MKMIKPGDAEPAPVAAVILAAGLGSRFRASDASIASKLVAPLDGAPLVRHVARAALASQARPLIVVTGHAEAVVREALAGLPADFVHNPDYASGLSTSLKAGLAKIPTEAAGALVLLGDMPRIAATTLDRLIALFRERPNCAAVVPAHAGVRGNPVLLARRLFPAIAHLRGDQGARRLLEDAGVEVVEWETDEAVGFDVDTPEELQRARAEVGHKPPT
jgi:molybdenum cofactor cytidylyltransferase